MHRLDTFLFSKGNNSTSKIHQDRWRIPKCDFYRPQRSWAKVTFLQASVILSTEGCLPQCMLGYHTPRSRHPLGADTPQGQTPPRGRHPREQTPWEQTPPRADTSPPPPLGADPPGKQTLPYGQ